MKTRSPKLLAAFYREPLSFYISVQEAYIELPNGYRVAYWTAQEFDKVFSPDLDPDDTETLEDAMHWASFCSGAIEDAYVRNYGTQEEIDALP